MEVRMMIGLPASGKTTHRATYENYKIICRDELGGTLNDHLGLFAEHLIKKTPVVLDATFTTPAVRAPYLNMARSHGVPVIAVVMGTSFEDAQFNACARMIQKTGRISNPGEKTNDPNLFPVAVLYKYRKEYQPPTTAEGFASIERITFVRKLGIEFAHKAIILDADGTVRVTKSGNKWPTSPDDVRLLPGRAEIIKKFAKTHLILGASNQSAIAKGDVTEEQVKACFAETNRQLGVNIKWSYCPHKVPPISCYCRKPGPAMGVQMIYDFHLDPKQCIYVGDMGTDKSFAARCGFQFQTPEQFFGR